MNNQNAPLNPYVNQLANKELISPNKSLNTGIASAMIQAMIHSTSTIANQIPNEPQLLLLMRSVPRNMRTYMYFEATWPLITPATTIVGMAMP